MSTRPSIEGRAPEANAIDLDNRSLSLPATSPATDNRPGRKTDRKSPRRKPTLAAAVEVSKWSKNRSGHAIVVRLNTFDGHLLIDVRTFLPGSDGRLQPGKGFSANIKHVGALAKAFAKAETTARELGLIDGGAAA